MWLRTARRYWPGSRYVDAVGSTMIDFGGDKDYTVAAVRAAPAHAPPEFRKPLVLAETNTEYDGRVAWLRDLRRMLRGMPWVRAVMWSQLPSRGKAHRAGAGGIVDWDVQRDPPAAAALRRIIEDGVRWRAATELADGATADRARARGPRVPGALPPRPRGRRPRGRARAGREPSRGARDARAARVEVEPGRRDARCRGRGRRLYDYVDHLADGGAPAVDARRPRRRRRHGELGRPARRRRHRRARPSRTTVDEPDDGDEPDAGDADDARRADEDEDDDEDEDEQDEDEDEDEPDEEEPDEVGPDIDDLTDDEVVEDEPRRVRRARRADGDEHDAPTTATTSPTSATSTPSTPATTPRASRSRPGWPARRSGAGSRPSCP